MTSIRILLPLVVLLLVLPACNMARAQPPTITPTITTVRVPPATPVPTLARVAQIVRTPTPLPVTATPTPDPRCEALESEAITHHRVEANIDFAHYGVVVAQTTHYINRTDETLWQIVFNIEPNRWPGAFSLNRVTSDSQELTHQLKGRRLTVDLAVPLPPDCETIVELRFGLSVPPIGLDVTAYKGFFGHSTRQMNLGHWLPTVAVRQGETWVTRDAVLVGEQDVLGVADWDVTLTLIGDRIPIIAAPGTPLQMSETSWRYTFRNARDFAISLSDAFVLTTQQAANGTTVELYSFPDAQFTLDDGTRIDSARHALNVAAQSVALYSDLFGDYGYDRLVIVQGDFPDGMEHSGLVFVGGNWFTRYAGNPASYLTLITVHEVAHQWWYARVGSDAALTPWLDEALATYSEVLYLEAAYPMLVDWWWDTRVDLYGPQGFVDGTVYEFATIREYINAVYLRGTRMMQDLRDDLGDAAFLDWLGAYAEAASGQLATPDTFWALLTEEQLAATQTTREQYLRQPQVRQSSP